MARPLPDRLAESQLPITVTLALIWCQGRERGREFLVGVANGPNGGPDPHDTISIYSTNFVRALLRCLQNSRKVCCVSKLTWRPQASSSSTLNRQSPPQASPLLR
uniref:Uncharacterized protein n=1 Tax=Steinernema glaseri TaxID=37863 RepID=A0A1I7YIU8_9BILA